MKYENGPIYSRKTTVLMQPGMYRELEKDARKSKVSVSCIIRAIIKTSFQDETAMEIIRRSAELLKKDQAG